MSKIFEIVPDVLESNVAEIQRKIDRIKGDFSMLHVDIIDGLFADNITVSVSDLDEINRGDVELEVHLMVDDPFEHIDECVQVGCRSVMAQIERMGNQGAFVDEIHGNKMLAGLAVDLYTPIEALEKKVIEEVDSVLLMSVKTGFSGQKFSNLVVDKIKNLRKIFQGRIVVDGGINDLTVGSVIDAGADGVAVNSYLWEGNIEDNVRRLYGKKS